MQRKKPRYYRGLLNQKGQGLGNLLENAQMFRALLELGRDVLPEELSPHLVGVFFEQRNLILQIDQAIWATQLRFYEPNILGVFQENLPHLQLNRIKVKVIPAAKEPEKRTMQMQPLSRQNALQMKELSEHIHDEKLRESLRKLSEHHS